MFLSILAITVYGDSLRLSFTPSSEHGSSIGILTPTFAHVFFSISYSYRLNSTNLIISLLLNFDIASFPL